jgi:hypothetical protein
LGAKGKKDDLTSYPATPDNKKLKDSNIRVSPILRKTNFLYRSETTILVTVVTVIAKGNNRGRKADGQLKMGLNMAIDRDLTPSPTMEETSMLLKIFDKEKWHNIPKCIFDIIQALVSQVETNRFDIRDSFKKHVASLQNMDKKLMKQEQDSYKIKDDVSRKLQTFSYEMNAKIGEAQKDIDEALLKIADST